MKQKQLLRRLVCLLLAATICMGMVLPGFAYYNVSRWAAESIAKMDELGLIPDCLRDADMSGKITRLEMCRVAVLAFEKITGVESGAISSGISHFSDTKDPAVIAAYDLGIVNGYPDGTFRPNNTLTRQEFIKIVYSLLTTGLYWDPSTVNAADITGFSDYTELNNYAVKPTQIMVSIGVVNGNADGTLNPKGNTSRQEALTMFLRAYNFITAWNKQKEEEEAFYTGEPKPPDPIYNHGFSNISAWAISEIRQMDELGLIPESLATADMTKGITRQQMCESAVLAYNKVNGEEYQATRTDYFTDTEDPYICAAYELKIVTGYGDGTFGPEDTLKREQFFKIVLNFMQSLGYSRTDSRSVSLSSYKDGGSVSSWAQAPARVLIYIGVLKGSGNKLNPKSATSCQEGLALFLRCYKFVNGWLETHPDGVDDEEPVRLTEEIVAFAKMYLGYDYVYGGKDPSTGFDCSGFMYYIYHHFGYYIPRIAPDQMWYSKGVQVSRDELRPGDLVFFASNIGGTSAGHVGMYVGDNLFIHAANPSKGVILTSLSDSWYAARYIGATRIVLDDTP